MNVLDHRRKEFARISKAARQAFDSGDVARALRVARTGLDAGLPADYVHYACAFYYFAAGRFAEAFYGLHLRRAVVPDPFGHLPTWNGEVLRGPALVWCPPGASLGGEIMHLGFLKHIARLDQEVVIACNPQLTRRLSVVHPTLSFVSRDDTDALKSVDFKAVATVLSLGHIAQHLGGRFEDRAVSYLGASKARSTRLRQRYLDGAPDGTRLVAIAWRQERRTSLQATLRHARAEGPFKAVSVTSSLSGRDSALCAQAGVTVPKAVDVSADLDQLVDLLSACDKVVTGDSDIAHIAGAAGCRVGFMRPDLPAWEWRPDQSASFWYPKLRFIPV
ncbi:hypothetical protein FLX56_03870 [Synechococcus moorigangaii CMS01]|nr:hypothetical protein [Synechococcus moorigangaii CMS01]